MENNQEFNYTYSAAQQQEVEEIRKKYLPKEEDKMEKLRKLHNSATQKAQAWSIALGTVGTLILGIGMSLTMSDFGNALGAYAMMVGIFVGVVGMVLALTTYPIYKRILSARKKKYAPEILRLSEQIMNR